jgi:hypothetical protein
MVKILKCNLEYLYWYAPKEGEEEAESYREMRLKAAARWQLLQEMGVDVSDHADTGHIRNILLSEQQAMQLMVAGYTLEVKSTVNVDPSGPDGMIEVMANFNMMANKLLALPAADRAYNSKCEVHMPGQALSTYNEVMLLENTCSDELQTHIDHGWRMIAACPQPDQRRPDYILGRYNPNRSIPSTYAERGR